MSGAIIWFTGLSGAGKTTLARAVSVELQGLLPVEVLDGDEIRTLLSKDLGFTRNDRDTNIRRIGFVARLLARHDVLVIVAAISPYAETRGEMRELAESERIPFLEVFVDAKLETLIGRDVKGLYKRALAGELPHFTGVSDTYEPPVNPSLAVTTDSETVDVSAAKVLRLLADKGLISTTLR
jgi:adenylylsulfate kinase